MICTLNKRVALHVRGLNSYSMIVEIKTICLGWTNVPSLERPRGLNLKSTAQRQRSPMHQREASRQSSLRALVSEQLKRLIENLALPVPELSKLTLG